MMGCVSYRETPHQHLHVYLNSFTKMLNLRTTIVVFYLLVHLGIGVEEPYLLNRYQILAKNLNFSVFHRDDLDQNNFRYKRSDVNNFGGVAVSSMRYMDYGRLGISGARSDKGGKSGGLPIGNNDNLINRQLTSCHPTHPNRADSYSCRGDSLTQVPHGLPVNITKL